MKEYKCIKIRRYATDTEAMLNQLSMKGWELVCSYDMDNEWLILQREIKSKN